MIRNPTTGLAVVLTEHLKGMSKLMLESRDGFLDLGREVSFFVELGYWKYLAKDQHFVEAWQLRHDPDRPVPHGMTVQEANYKLDLACLGLACRVYAQCGLLVREETPHDAPEAEEVEA
jgi:hypothetical protein